MEGLFRQIGILCSVRSALRAGRFGPVDVLQGDQKGQVLQEGITEAGSMSSWIAAATSYASNGLPMIPFIYLLFDVRFSAHR